MKKSKSLWLIVFIILDVVMTLGFLANLSRSKPTEKIKTYEISYIVDGEVYETKNYTLETLEIEVPSVPEKEHYTGEWEKCIFNGGDKRINAIYTPIEYEVTYTANGETVAIKTYTIENTEITPPEMPLEEYETDEGYVMVGVWEDVQLDGEDKIVNAVYEEKTYSITYIVVPDTGYPDGVDENLFNNYWSGALYSDGFYPTSYKSSEGAYISSLKFENHLPVGANSGRCYMFYEYYDENGYFIDDILVKIEPTEENGLSHRIFELQKGTKGDLILYIEADFDYAWVSGDIFDDLGDWKDPNVKN